LLSRLFIVVEDYSRVKVFRNTHFVILNQLPDALEPGMVVVPHGLKAVFIAFKSNSQSTSFSLASLLAFGKHF